MKMYMHKDGIRLRKVDRTDLNKLLELKQESWWGTHGTPVINMADQERWLESMSGSQMCMIAEKLYVLKEKFGDEEHWLSVGVAIYSEIDWVGRSLSLSGSIYKDRRGGEFVKGAFAAGLDFAFEILNMRRVEAEVMEYNLPAQRLEIDYLGFRVEGRKRQAVYKSGRYYDSLVLGLLREEWESDQRVIGYSGSCNQTIDHQRLGGMASRSIRDTQQAR